MFYCLQPRTCKPLISIQIHHYRVWVWLNSDLCILGLTQLLLFIVELQGNEDGREKDKIEWDKPDKVIGSAFVFLCSALDQSVVFIIYPSLPPLCWINQRPSPSLPLIWSFLYQGCVVLSLQSSLLFLSLQPTLWFYPPVEYSTFRP